VVGLELRRSGIQAKKVRGLKDENDAHPPEVQEAFQFLLATAMYEAGKFELLNVAEVDGRWHYTFSGAGEVFSVVRPEMSKETERQVGEMVREILREEGVG
jgi:hypothetical protein